MTHVQLVKGGHVMKPLSKLAALTIAVGLFWAAGADAQLTVLKVRCQPASR